MVLPWIGLAPIVQNPTVERIDATLTVIWRRKSVDIERNVATFSEGVEIQYGPTTVRADRLVLHLDPEERHGRADGNVLLTDPDGTIHASALAFNWLLRTGDAENVELDALDVMIRARSMHIEPNRWEFLDVEASPCDENPSPVSLRSPRIVIEPGKRATLTKARLAVFGLALPTLPKAIISLDRRATGLRPPTVSQRRGAGIGLQWNSGFLLDDQTSLAGAFSTFPRSRPSYSLEIARSTVDPEAATGIIGLRSDLSERFRHGYFDNVSVAEPEQEHKWLDEPRNTLSVGSYWSQYSFARAGNASFNKPLEVGYETAMRVPGASGIAQLRAQRIDEVGGGSATRATLSASVAPRSIRLGSGLETHIRFDTSVFASQNGPYGWTRAQIGVLARPVSGLTLGLAYVDSAQAGTPDFDIDRLLSSRGWIYRVDYAMGPRSISYMQKWDSPSRAWFDREYAVKQTMGCFEGSVTYREVANEFRFGLQLRLDRFVNAIQRREVRRENPPPR